MAWQLNLQTVGGNAATTHICICGSQVTVNIHVGDSQLERVAGLSAEPLSVNQIISVDGRKQRYAVGHRQAQPSEHMVSSTPSCTPNTLTMPLRMLYEHIVLSVENHTLPLLSNVIDFTSSDGIPVFAPSVSNAHFRRRCALCSGSGHRRWLYPHCPVGRARQTNDVRVLQSY